MPIKVVKGLLATVEPKLTSLNDKSSNPAAQAPAVQSNPQTLANNAAAKMRSTEAAINLLRSTRDVNFTQTVEKVRDHKEAKNLAHDVAGQIREQEDDGLDAHEKLESVAAKKHLM